MDYECVCLRHPDEYPMNEGHVVTTSGLDVPVEEYEQHFQERHIAAEHGPAQRQAARTSGATWSARWRG